MCMITYIPANVDIPWRGILNGGIGNPDGHGWAAAKGDTLLVGKSMDLETAATAFDEAVTSLGAGTVSLFHSRIATAGTVDEYNVHPFYVGGESTVMAHNGILPSRWQPKRTDRRSDTRLFADQIAHQVANPRGVPSRKSSARMGHAIGAYNKLVFLSVVSGQPRTRIVNANQGVYQGGVWYSNYGFEDYVAPKARYSTGRPAWWDEDKAWWEKEEPVTGHPSIADPCILCRGEVDFGYCIDCRTCQDCLVDEPDCLCYTPASVKSIWEYEDDGSMSIASPLVVGLTQERQTADAAALRESLIERGYLIEG